MCHMAMGEGYVTGKGGSSLMYEMVAILGCSFERTFQM